jgi:hypothetical protein
LSIRHLLLPSSSAKADDPVNAALSIFTTVKAYWMPRLRV